MKDVINGLTFRLLGRLTTAAEFDCRVCRGVDRFFLFFVTFRPVDKENVEFVIPLAPDRASND